MKRTEQFILILTFITFSWLGMQVVHELGHVAAAHATGARVLKVYLHPLIISETDIDQNSHPLIVVWAGCLTGTLLPLLAFGIAKLCRAPGLYLFRFFAAFCLVANGVYIGMGSSKNGWDTEVMLDNGSPRWLMVLFGLATYPLGLYLWHKLGPNFGLGQAKGKVDRKATITSAALLLTLVTVELIMNSQ